MKDAGRLQIRWDGVTIFDEYQPLTVDFTSSANGSVELKAQFPPADVHPTRPTLRIVRDSEESA